MITFYSNFINEHQIPFCNAMYKKTNGQFRFIATEPISEQRLKMGFEDQSKNFPYVICSFENHSTFQKALQLGKISDVVIIGSAPELFIRERLKANKLTFRYCERYFKQGRWRILDPRVLKAHYLNDYRYRRKKLYMLCASAYTASDCRFIHSYPDKTYKWGYFPEVKTYSDIEKVISLKRPASILWVGRHVGWKHPEAVLKVAESLQNMQESPFGTVKINIIGEGELTPKLHHIIHKKGFQDKIRLYGFMSPEKVRHYMEQADIFLFTSDHNEGWGAVLNEAMNSACAVIACKEIGSVPYLIKNGENGLIYDRHKKGDLVHKVCSLIENEQIKRKMQLNAYKTLQTTWNADVAAERLLCLIDAIQSGREVQFTSGPCSRD